MLGKGFFDAKMVLPTDSLKLFIQSQKEKLMDTIPVTDSFKKQIAVFAIKASIVFFLFTIVIPLLIPDPKDLANSVRKAAKDEKTRVILMSFIDNPVSLYRASELDEKDGNLQSAIMEMETAIGLLELHNVNQQIMNRYTTRLNNLKDQLKSSNK
jgi:hypothetical protein